MSVVSIEEKERSKQEKKEKAARQKELTDPCGDELYKNLSLKDFLRHFVPQEEEARKEVDRINKEGSLPFMDPNIPETMPRPKTRTERRAIMLKKRKDDKKKERLNTKVKALMENPTALQKAMEKDPKIKYVAQKMLQS